MSRQMRQNVSNLTAGGVTVSLSHLNYNYPHVPCKDYKFLQTYDGQQQANSQLISGYSWSHSQLCAKDWHQ